MARFSPHLPQRLIERAEGSAVNPVASVAPQHHQVGVLDATLVVALVGEVQPVLSEDHAASVPRRLTAISVKIRRVHAISRGSSGELDSLQVPSLAAYRVRRR